MSSENLTPDLPLCAGLVSITGYPIVAGSFFVVLFGSRAQREHDALKERFGASEFVGFFPQFDAFFTYAFTGDPSSKIFSPAGPVQTKPDPTEDLPGFIRALKAAGTDPGGEFSPRTLLDALVTTPVRTRAYAVLDREYGDGSTDRFEDVLGAIVQDANR